MKVLPISLTEKLALNDPVCDLYFSQESTLFVNVKNHISDDLTSSLIINVHEFYVVHLCVCLSIFCI